jgi:trehalose utilization protein
VINEHEMYGEFFDIPVPDELIFISTFSGGEVFRSGCCWRRGKGKIFYFSPGDQEYPIYHLPDVKRVLANAVQWARPENIADSNPPSVVNSPAPYFDARVVAGGVSS